MRLFGVKKFVVVVAFLGNTFIVVAVADMWKNWVNGTVKLKNKKKNNEKK